MRALFSKSPWASVFLMVLAALPAVANGQTQGDMTVAAAVIVLDDVMSIPGKQIPQRLINEAHGVAIIPGVVKGGFVVGVRHGRGVVLVKDDAGNWHQPTFITMTGGSVGWQAGIQSTDLVLVFKSRSSVNNLMSGQLKIGVDAAAAAGPVGREAEAATDVRLAAEIYSYSRSRGLFAGVSLEGSGLQVDHLANRAYYRSDAAGNPTMLPESAVRLMDRVAHYSGSGTIVAAPNVPTSPPPQPLPQGPVSSQSEAVRQQLVASWTQLSVLLDDQWKAYLALPAGLVTGQQTASAEELEAALRRYAAIANNPQYASLVQRQEFATTYQLLRQYATVRSTEAKRLNLPPPPTNNADVLRGRYSY